MVTLARPQLAHVARQEARDPATITALCNAANGAMSARTGAEPSIAPDLLREACAPGMLSGDATFGDRLIAAFQGSQDEYFRSSVIYAMAGSEDPAYLDKVLALRAQMRKGELGYVYQYMQAEPVARVQLWSWFKDNYPMILKRLSPFGMLPGAADPGRCVRRASRSDLEGVCVQSALSCRARCARWRSRRSRSTAVSHSSRRAARKSISRL